MQFVCKFIHYLFLKHFFGNKFVLLFRFNFYRTVFIYLNYSLIRFIVFLARLLLKESWLLVFGPKIPLTNLGPIVEADVIVPYPFKGGDFFCLQIYI